MKYILESVFHIKFFGINILKHEMFFRTSFFDIFMIYVEKKKQLHKIPKGFGYLKGSHNSHCKYCIGKYHK